jgi:hypothetical protein
MTSHAEHCVYQKGARSSCFRVAALQLLAGVFKSSLDGFLGEADALGDLRGALALQAQPHDFALMGFQVP